MKKTWKELFPDALLGENGQDAVPVTLNGEVIYLLESTLTERERFLIETLNTQPTKNVNPNASMASVLRRKRRTAHSHSVYPMRTLGGISKARRRLSRKRLVGVRRELNGWDPCRLQKLPPSLHTGCESGSRSFACKHAL